LNNFFIFNKPWLLAFYFILASLSSSHAWAAYTSIAESSAINNKFPLRSHFSSALIISHQELADNFQDMLIIDVRSAYEFQVLHIEGAINVPITNLGFIPTLKVLRASDNRTIVFYCNGATCKKSYLANINAQQHDIDNIYTFDLGILAWAKRYPERSTFFDETPLVVNKLISHEKFAAHSLSPKEFFKKITKNTLVIDIREPFQRNIKILEQKSILAPLKDFHRVLAARQKKTLNLINL